MSATQPEEDALLNLVLDGTFQDLRKNAKNSSTLRDQFLEYGNDETPDAKIRFEHWAFWLASQFGISQLPEFCAGPVPLWRLLTASAVRRRIRRRTRREIALAYQRIYLALYRSGSNPIDVRRLTETYLGFDHPLEILHYVHGGIVIASTSETEEQLFPEKLKTRTTVYCALSIVDLIDASQKSDVLFIDERANLPSFQVLGAWSARLLFDNSLPYVARFRATPDQSVFKANFNVLGDKSEQGTDVYYLALGALNKTLPQGLQPALTASQPGSAVSAAGVEVPAAAFNRQGSKIDEHSVGESFDGKRAVVVRRGFTVTGLLRASSLTVINGTEMSAPYAVTKDEWAFETVRPACFAHTERGYAIFYPETPKNIIIVPRRDDATAADLPVDFICSLPNRVTASEPEPRTLDARLFTVRLPDDGIYRLVAVAIYDAGVEKFLSVVVVDCNASTFEASGAQTRQLVQTVPWELGIISPTLAFADTTVVFGWRTAAADGVATLDFRTGVWVGNLPLGTQNAWLFNGYWGPRQDASLLTVVASNYSNLISGPTAVLPAAAGPISRIYARRRPGDLAPLLLEPTALPGSPIQPPPPMEVPVVGAQAPPLPELVGQEFWDSDWSSLFSDVADEPYLGGEVDE